MINGIHRLENLNDSYSYMRQPYLTQSKALAFKLIFVSLHSV